MAVRLGADWMVLADERILEFLDSEGPQPPSEIAADERVRFSTQHVNKRLWKLTDAGLTRRIGQGVYAITEQGEGYLAGELDAASLEEPE